MAGIPNRYYSAIAQDTNLSTSCTSGDVTIVVTTTTGWPTQYPFCLALDFGTSLEELVDVTSLIGLTATVTRGVDSTVAVGHTAGAVVRHVITARDIRETEQHVANTTGVHGVTGNVVGDTDTQTLTNKDLTSATNTFPYSGAWTAYVPTLTTSSGTLTTVSAGGRYKVIGKTCIVAINIFLTNVGTGSGLFSVSLPFTAAAFNQMGVLKEVTTGKSGTIDMRSSASTAYLADSVGGSLIVNAYNIEGTITYETV